MKKYKLLKDTPQYKAGTVFQYNQYEEGYTAVSDPQRLVVYWEKGVDDTELFEPLSPQEEVEELTENDFQKELGTSNCVLTQPGRDKLIRKLNSIGKDRA